jgi:hypothetical protein
MAMRLGVFARQDTLYEVIGLVPEVNLAEAEPELVSIIQSLQVD